MRFVAGEHAARAVKAVVLVVTDESPVAGLVSAATGRECQAQWQPGGGILFRLLGCRHRNDKGRPHVMIITAFPGQFRSRSSPWPINTLGPGLMLQVSRRNCSASPDSRLLMMTVR